MATPQDSYELLKYNMVHAHNTFKLGYKTILSHLESPPKNDLKNFLGYCEAWAVSIEAHHESEVSETRSPAPQTSNTAVQEEIVFPFLNEKLDFSGEAKQHEAIHGNLDRILAFTHLDEEVEHISASNLRNAQFAERDILTMIGKLESHAKSHGDPFLLVPFMRRSVFQFVA
ncbi:hypothetical protein DXG03_000745 [Asterophora parasitica]|uniref:Hemerythrin-like domain-containing protein n=1 Tax=Asterophora parasitica TaxID=117018 RepID=A0A9P7G5Z7_9AGAR|nr:hypothetical protein DXG03_000745 [Asterophora parasitica]